MHASTGHGHATDRQLGGIFEMARQLHGFCDLAGIPLLSVDSDGQVGELIPLATATEVNVELRRLVPLARSGGHIINPDHAIPAEVPYGDFLYLIERLGREMGACL